MTTATVGVNGTIRNEQEYPISQWRKDRGYVDWNPNYEEDYKEDKKELDDSIYLI